MREGKTLQLEHDSEGHSSIFHPEHTHGVLSKGTCTPTRQDQHLPALQVSVPNVWLQHPATPAHYAQGAGMKDTFVWGWQWERRVQPVVLCYKEHIPNLLT